MRAHVPGSPTFRHPPRQCFQLTSRWRTVLDNHVSEFNVQHYRFSVFQISQWPEWKLPTKVIYKATFEIYDVFMYSLMWNSTTIITEWKKQITKWCYYNIILLWSKKKYYNLCEYVFLEEKKKPERNSPNISSGNLQVVGFSGIFTCPYPLSRII